MRDPKNDNSLNELINKCEWIIDKNYLGDLSECTFCPSHNIAGTICLFEIAILAEPAAPHFFVFVLNALGGLQEVFGYILQFSKNRLKLYIGLKTAENKSTAIDILQNGLESCYPNSKFRVLSKEESCFVLEKLFNSSQYHALSVAVAIPGNTSPEHTPVNQKLIDLMQNESFTALFLAAPIGREEARRLVKELEDLYTELSTFAETNYSFTHIFSKNTAVHVTKSTTENSSDSCLITDNKIRGCTASKGIVITPAGFIPFKETPGFTIGAGYNQTSGIIKTDEYIVAKGETKGCSDAKSNLSIHSTTYTDSDTVSFNKENRQVIDLLEKIDHFIKRLKSAASQQLFCFSAYFLSENPAASIRAAYTYAGLAKEQDADTSSYFVITWKDYDENFSDLIEEIGNFNHLSFEFGSKNKCVPVSSLITASELLNSFYFPYQEGEDIV